MKFLSSPQQTRCQDILSHQTMVDAISDKGSALASTKAKSKLNTLNAKYGALCQAAQAQVRLLSYYFLVVCTYMFHNFILNKQV